MLPFCDVRSSCGSDLILVMRTQRRISIGDQRRRVEIQNRQLSDGATHRQFQRLRREITELQRDRAVEARIDEASRDVHQKSTSCPRRFALDTGNEMRGNAYGLLRPGQCELPGLEENAVRDPLIAVLSRKPNVSNDIAMQVHLNGCRLNGLLFERVDSQYAAVEEARDSGR